MIVELKSCGGFKLFRSSIIDADRVADTENEIDKSRMMKFAVMEAMEKFVYTCRWVLNAIFHVLLFEGDFDI